MTRHYSAEDTETDAAKQYDQEDAMTKCGCRIEYHVVNQYKDADRIIQCPLHREAGRLLEALKNIVLFRHRHRNRCIKQARQDRNNCKDAVCRCGYENSLVVADEAITAATKEA